MPCKKNLRRVDNTGRAKAGSQRQIQIQVNSRQEEFGNEILRLLSLPPLVEANLRWVSPLVEDGFNEYQDGEFLGKLKLGQHLDKLKGFWPKGGPCWDALAIIEGITPHGVVLVEAKSHVSEMTNACNAGSVSRERIRNSLALTACSLDVEMNSSWTENYYQIANRYAHLYFLREIAKIPAWLVNVYFVNDESIKHVEPPPRSASEWREKLEQVKERMGLSAKSIPFTSDLFLEAVNT